MKRFDYESVKSRLVDRAKMDMDSATLLDDSAFSMVLDVFSEGISEVARYIEYNTNEKKWSNAQNLTSLTHMGKLIGRKRKRPVSAMGYILVSHTDDTGNPRLPYYGQNFFELDQSSDYDDIKPDPKIAYNYIQKSALVPWTCADVYTIPKGTIFHTANNIQFISTSPVSARVLMDPYSTILASEEKYESFITAGGWDGIKYVKVPVIQGIERVVDLGVTNGQRFQSFYLEGANIEGGYNSISKKYFYVEIEYQGAQEKLEKWAEIQNIRLAGPYDKVFEAVLSESGDGIIIKLGDGISGYIPPKASKVKLHYLETVGAAGNILQAGQIVDEIAFPSGYKKVDPRTNRVYEFLNCTNNISISGGRDMEDYSEYKRNAPLSYLKSYTTAVKSAYEEQIMNNSPVLLSKLKCFPDTSFTASQVDTTPDIDVNDVVANEVSVISNSLNITAIKADGTKFDKELVESEFIQPIIKTIGDIKGPNDTLSYTEPNFIKIAPSLKINTYDLNTSDTEVSDQVSAAVTAKYSIFNTDFGKPFYSSDITHQAALLNFTDSVNIQIEALANVSFEEDKILLLSSSNSASLAIEKPDWKKGKTGTLVAIPFNFDPIFSSNKYKRGFKNYTVDSQYLLKVDLRFINNAAKENKSRTFFLYDNRIDSGTVESLQEGKFSTLNNEGNVTVNGTIPNTSAKLGISKLTFADESDENFTQRCVRVAQFSYITNITDEEFMNKAKSWKVAPFENRPYTMDGEGKIKKVVDRDDSHRENYDGNKELNRNWIPFVDIIFNENYDQPTSAQYASGYFVIPLTYLGFDDVINKANEQVFMMSLSSLLKQFIELKVYAIPKQEDIEPKNWQDIVFIDDDDIKVERNLKYQK